MSRRTSSPFVVEPLEGRVLLASIPAGYVETVVASGLNTPTAMQFAPDGRLFVAQQSGQLRVIDDGALVGTPVLTVTVNNAGERGLLGLAFDPNFNANQFIYVYYTATTPNLHNRLSRFTLNGNVAVPGSETVLLDLDPLVATNHNGGALRFGGDGKLYVAVGENAVGSNAQTLTNLHGKMLRLNADGSIPTDNPFYNTATGKNRAIWALGLRNPFTFDVERGTGKMYVNDVGQSTWEEINLGVRGANYGWPTTEGATTDARFASPLYTYPHFRNGVFDAAAIAGGSFYDPVSVSGAGAFPASNVGDYFFADYVGNWVRKIDTTGAQPVETNFATNVASPVDLEVSAAGHLYVLERGNGGRVLRISYGSQPPSITDQPDSKSVSLGQSVTFSVAATGTQPLNYRWTRNGATIAGATGPSYTINSVSQADVGVQFRAVVTNQYGTATSNPATVSLTGNTAPSASITSPAAGTLFNGGQTFSFAGSATDAQDGTLAASRFSWRVDLHHGTHTHPFVPTTNGVTGGQFTIPTTGHTETNIFYRIHLTVTDSAGASTTVTRDLQPRLVNLTARTNVPGLSLTLDGQPVTSPTTTPSVVGVQRTLGAAATQTLDGVTYQFTGWSDGGAATHTVSTPATSTTYTANYTPVGAGSAGLQATYFNNIDFTGTTVSRVDPTVDFNWGSGGPAAGIAADTFSARWVGTVTPQFSQTYTFYTQGDDRVRLWVNGVQLVNDWTDHPVKENSGSIALVAGQKYDIRVEFAENGGSAVMRLLWSSASQAKQVIPGNRLTNTPPAATTAGLRATYYDNINFTGKVVGRVDGNVNFDWGTGVPVSGIAADTFSVRWTGRVTPQFSQTYTFYTQADDRVRLWVNGVLLVNDWTDHAVKENSGTIALVGGQAYDIRVDYAENGIHAVAKLLWSSASQPKQVIPTNRLTASPVGATLASANVNGATPTGGTTAVLPGLAYDVVGGGAAGVTGTSDSFRFVYRSIAGDFDVRSRIESFTAGTSSHAKAGLMARTSLNGNSANVASLVTPTLYASSYRPTTGGDTLHTIETAVAFPDVWVRLRRAGDTFQTYRSADGVNWTLTRTVTVDLPDTLLVGLAASSKNGGATTTVKFRDVAV